MQTSINRSVARSKEVVYDVVSGDETLFRAVIMPTNELLVVHPGTELSKAEKSALDKLIAKAKHRDGIADHRVVFERVLVENGKDLEVRLNTPQVDAFV
ncbi:hypothetical protein pEaSNUABM6_00124 [Erwinia phage pEa_SNUABM_6]|nr:hypothetical protein pEaSNUABM6_00124 [Erwinia phage pEa_SNUABM_6]